MATLLDLRRRIRSVRNIRQITRAMKMVAAAKLRRAQEGMERARPYSDKMWDVLNELAQRSERRDHRLLRERREDRVTAVVITSDRGLCGSFNTNVLRYAHRALRAWQDQSVRLVTVGRKGHAHFRRLAWPIDRAYPDVLADLTFAQAAEAARYLMGEFTEDRTDAVYLIYNEFKSVLLQNLVVEPLVPIRGVELSGAEGVSARAAARAVAEVRTGGEVEEGFGAVAAVATEWGEAQEASRQLIDAQREPTGMGDYLYEPSPDAILDQLLPLHVETQVYHALMESIAAEHAARMTAMDNATKNADEMIDNLTLTMNKIRQEDITTEILEVVGGAEALK